MAPKEMRASVGSLLNKKETTELQEPNRGIIMPQVKREHKPRPQIRAYQAAKAALAASAKVAVEDLLVKENYEIQVKETGKALTKEAQFQKPQRMLFLNPTTQELTIHGRQVLWWVLAHPGATQQRIQEEFPGNKWTLNALMNSPAFNREYKEALERVNQHVIGTMVAKLSETSVALLSQIGNRANSGKATENFLVQAGELVLRALGFSPEAVSPATKIDIGVGNQQSINIQVDGDQLNKARDLAAQAFKGASEARLLPPTTVIDVTPNGRAQ